MSDVQRFQHVRQDVRPFTYDTVPCVLDSDSLLSISADVHDVWRSTLEPGYDTPFEPSFAVVEGTAIDLANTTCRDLPVPFQEVSVASGAIILSMINTTLACRTEIESMHIQKMSINLFSLWNVIKLGHSLTLERAKQYLDSPYRVKILDQRMVMAGVASLWDDERYTLWREYYHMDQVRELPGVRRYGLMGRQIIDAVRHEQSPVPVPSDVDMLY